MSELKPGLPERLAAVKAALRTEGGPSRRGRETDCRREDLSRVGL